MLVDAATFAFVALAALSLKVRRRPGAAGRGRAAPRARDGIAFLFRDRALALVMIVAFSSLLFMSAVWVGELFFVEDVLGSGDVAYGTMLSIWTMGMALGAMLLSRRVAIAAVAATGLAAAATQGAALALPALWLSFAFCLACSFVGGLAHGLKNVMFRSLIHVSVPERPARARLRRLQRHPQLGRAGRLRSRGRARRRDRRPRHARLRRRPLRPRRRDRPAGAAADVQADGLPTGPVGAADRDRPRRRAAPSPPRPRASCRRLTPAGQEPARKRSTSAASASRAAVGLLGDAARGARSSPCRRPASRWRRRGRRPARRGGRGRCR